MLAFTLALAVLAAPSTSPWDGEWTLDVGRSSAAAKEGAADGYRFHVADGTLRWEIPSLKEDFTIRIGGAPSAVRRGGVAQKTSIAVRELGPAAFTYRVSVAGKPVGEGHMQLVDSGKAWVDLNWPADRPLLGSEIVYVKR